MRRRVNIITYVVLIASIMGQKNCLLAVGEDEIDKGDLVKQYLQDQEMEADSKLTSVQSEAIVQYEKLIQTYDKTEKPDYYAGCYLDEDGGLVISVAGDSQNAFEDINGILKGGEFELQEVDYSYKDLEEAKNAVWDAVHVQPYESANLDILGFYIDEERNRVILEIDDLTEEKKAYLEDFFNYDSRYEYEKGYPLVKASDSFVIQPGYLLKNSSGVFSAGYRAYWTNDAGTRYNGFVTAAHCISNDLTIYTPEGVLIGICATKMDNPDKGIDAAFVRIVNSKFTVSNQVLYKDSKGTSGGVTLAATPWMSSITLNTTLYKSGYRTYLTSGAITATDKVMLFDGVYYKDLLESKTLVLSGDSGGCAYVYYNQAAYVKAGIVLGSTYSRSPYNESNFLRGYFVKASNIYNEMNIVPY